MKPDTICNIFSTVALDAKSRLLGIESGLASGGWIGVYRCRDARQCVRPLVVRRPIGASLVE